MRRRAWRAPHPDARRAVLLVCLVLGGLLAGAGAAAGDVVLQPDHTDAGARDVTVVFRVRNDDPRDPVVALQVDLPPVRRLEGVAAPPVPGWQVSVSAASVQWRGGPVDAAGVDLPITVGRMPDGAGPVRFRVLQTSRSGAVAEWSDLTEIGARAPAHPSLELPYGAPRAAPDAAAPAIHDHDHDHARQGREAAGAVPVPAGPAGAVRTAVVAVLLAGLTALAVHVLGRRQRARFTALRPGGPEADDPPAGEARPERERAAPPR